MNRISLTYWLFAVGSEQVPNWRVQQISTHLSRSFAVLSDVALLSIFVFWLPQDPHQMEKVQNGEDQARKKKRVVGKSFFTNESHHHLFIPSTQILCHCREKSWWYGTFPTTLKEGQHVTSISIRWLACNIYFSFRGVLKKLYSQKYFHIEMIYIHLQVSLISTRHAWQLTTR